MVAPLLFFSGIVVASLTLLLFASDLAVSGIAQYARKLGISDFLIGFIVVGIGTSLPELISSGTGAAIGEGGIVLGTLFGSLIGSYCLVLGIPAILRKKIKVSDTVKKRRNWPIIIIITIPALLSIDGKLGRLDGTILILLYIGYVYLLWTKEGSLGKIKKDVKLQNIWRDGAIFIGALIALLLSARWLVYSLIRISRDILGIDPFILAITIMGIAATVPDLLVEIRSIYQGHGHIGMGNVLGSGMLNMTVILGLVVLMNPFEIAFKTILPALIVTIAIMGYVLYIVHKGEFLRKHGILLAITYATFITIQLLI